MMEKFSQDNDYGDNQGCLKSHKYDEEQLQTNPRNSSVFPQQHKIWKRHTLTPCVHSSVSVCMCVCVCVCVIWSSAPWLTSASYLMDGWWLHHLFCLQAGNGFDWPSRQHSGSVALSVCISSRKLSCWKRLIIGLKSGVMIVYWTHFPLGFLSLSFFFFVSFGPFSFPHFLSPLSLSLSPSPCWTATQL